jgi:hypothetical protein
MTALRQPANEFNNAQMLCELPVQPVGTGKKGSSWSCNANA